jgi:hypothetical protein
MSEINARTAAAGSSLPRARAPGEKFCPALRMATNADAHSTKVTAAASSARRSGRGPGWLAGRTGPGAAWPKGRLLTQRRRCGQPEREKRMSSAASGRDRDDQPRESRLITAHRPADMVGVPALTGRCQDGAELAFWLACGCSLVLTMRVAVDKAIGSAV